MDEIKMICGNCIDFVKGYCDVRFVLKDSKRIGNLPVSKNKKSCSCFINKI